MNVIIDTLCGFSNNSVFVSHKERRKLYVGKTGQFTSNLGANLVEFVV